MSLWLWLNDPETGERRRPELTAKLRLESGDWVGIPLIVDSGSDLSIVPIEWVAEYDLAMNLIESHVRSFRTSSGAECFGFRGNLQVRFDGGSFSWPCLFSLPPGMTEPNAEDLLQELLVAPALPAARRNVANPGKVHTVETWMKRMFPEFHLRPALLGRLGFLDDFEVLICSDFVRVRRRSRNRDRTRKLVRSLARFLRSED